MTSQYYTGKHGADILLTALRDPVHTAGLGVEAWDLLRPAEHQNVRRALAQSEAAG